MHLSSLLWHQSYYVSWQICRDSILVELLRITSNSFLFVQVFLAVSLSAGVTTTIEELPDSIEAVPTVLAENLPKASNYFFSYIMMHALTTFALTLVQANGLIDMYILSPALDETARQKWMRGQNSGLQKWGTFIPVLTEIACIGMFLLRLLAYGELTL